MSTSGTSTLPIWADELRRRYLRGESSQFVLHGNVHDLTLVDGKLLTLSEFLSQVLLDRSKDTIALYNVSTGVRFSKRKMSLDGLEEMVLQKEPAKAIPLLQREKRRFRRSTTGPLPSPSTAGRFPGLSKRRIPWSF